MHMPAEEKFSRNKMLHVRLPEALRIKLDLINERYNTTDTRNVLALLEAFAESVAEADAVRFPVAVLLSEKQLMVAEGNDKLPLKPHPRPPDKPQRHRGDGPRRAVS